MLGSRYHVDAMTCQQLIRLLKDCKILGRKITLVDIDLIFVVKAKGSTRASRQINFEEFLAVLMKIAAVFYARGKNHRRIASKPEVALSSKPFFRLLFNHVLPFAQRWPKDEFRQVCAFLAHLMCSSRTVASWSQYQHNSARPDRNTKKSPMQLVGH